MLLAQLAEEKWWIFFYGTHNIYFSKSIKGDMCIKMNNVFHKTNVINKEYIFL